MLPYKPNLSYLLVDENTLNGVRGWDGGRDGPARPPVELSTALLSEMINLFADNIDGPWAIRGCVGSAPPPSLFLFRFFFFSLSSLALCLIVARDLVFPPPLSVTSDVNGMLDVQCLRRMSRSSEFQAVVDATTELQAVVLNNTTHEVCMRMPGGRP